MLKNIYKTVTTRAVLVEIMTNSFVATPREELTSLIKYLDGYGEWERKVRKGSRPTFLKAPTPLLNSHWYSIVTLYKHRKISDILAHFVC